MYANAQFQISECRWPLVRWGRYRIYSRRVTAVRRKQVAGGSHHGRRAGLLILRFPCWIRDSDIKCYWSSPVPSPFSNVFLHINSCQLLCRIHSQLSFIILAPLRSSFSSGGSSVCRYRQAASVTTLGRGSSVIEIYSKWTCFSDICTCSKCTWRWRKSHLNQRWLKNLSFDLLKLISATSEN